MARAAGKRGLRRGGVSCGCGGEGCSRRVSKDRTRGQEDRSGDGDLSAQVIAFVDLAMELVMLGGGVDLAVVRATRVVERG